MAGGLTKPDAGRERAAERGWLTRCLSASGGGLG